MKKIVSLILSIVLICYSLAGCVTKSSNNISTDGSTSIEKVIGALGEAFENDNPDVRFTYNPTGSSAGIIAVAEERCDIGLSSRKLKDEEKKKGLNETLLALDAIVIIVNPNNSINDLTLEQIAKIYKGEITSWKEIGGEDLEIVLIGREAGSGTRNGFESITKTEGECKYRQELTSAGDVITTVSKNENAIGYTSLASVKNNVKAISVNGVIASETTINNGSYQIQRPFVLVTSKNSKLSETAQSFFDYITSDAANEIILFAGAIPVK